MGLGRNNELSLSRGGRGGVRFLMAFCLLVLSGLSLLGVTGAKCSACGDVQAAAKKCSSDVSLGAQAALQTTLLLNCPAALYVS